jgi:hypothetical protein
MFLQAAQGVSGAKSQIKGEQIESLTTQASNIPMCRIYAGLSALDTWRAPCLGTLTSQASELWLLS